MEKIVYKLKLREMDIIESNNKIRWTQFENKKQKQKKKQKSHNRNLANLDGTKKY